MTRYRLEDWCDYVRGLAPDREAEEMRALFESGDRAAARAVKAFASVGEVARFDRANAVPEHAVRAVKALASVARPEKASRGERSTFLKYLMPQISFDSLRDAAPVGTRDLQPNTRQLVAQAETYTLDVRFEQESDPAGTVIVGQLLDGMAPLGETPVLIRSSGRIVGRSQTNRFGEFQVEGLPEPPLTLALILEDDTCFELTLDDGNP